MWSQLAAKYNIIDSKGNIAKNGGQIAKEYAKSVGVDVNRFPACKRKLNFETVRRAKKKFNGVSLTVDGFCKG